MARGRKAKPTALKLLQGNPGKRPLNRQEPLLTAGLPPKPQHLDRFAAEQWKYLTKMLGPARVLNRAEQGVLLVACDAYSQLRQCQVYLRKRKSLSYTIKTDNGDMHRPYPEVAQLNQARRHYLSALAELGLTPSARARVKTLPEGTLSGVEDYFSPATG